MFSTPPWGRNECVTNAPQKDVCGEAMVQTAQVKRRSVICSSTDAFLCPESETLIYCQPRFTDTGYLHTVYFHCHNYVIIVDIVPCSNNDSFLRVNKFLLQYCTKKNSTKVAWHIWFWRVSAVFRPVFDPCTTYSPLIKFSSSWFTRFTSLAFCCSHCS